MRSGILGQHHLRVTLQVKSFFFLSRGLRNKASSPPCTGNFQCLEAHCVRRRVREREGGMNFKPPPPPFSFYSFVYSPFSFSFLETQYFDTLQSLCFDFSSLNTSLFYFPFRVVFNFYPHFYSLLFNLLLNQYFIISNIVIIRLFSFLTELLIIIFLLAIL